MVDRPKHENQKIESDHSQKINRETRTYLHIREDMSINSVGQFGLAEGRDSSGLHFDEA
jgi:hypothetical protein